MGIYNFFKLLFEQIQLSTQTKSEIGLVYEHYIAVTNQHGYTTGTYH